MKPGTFLTLVLVSFVSFGGTVRSKAAEPVAETPPPTLMAVPTQLLVREDFQAPLAPFTGTPVGFASGFLGWKFNAGSLGGHWEVKDGSFQGRESLEANHPATASLGLRFQNVIVSCEARLDDLPLGGNRYRGFGIRLTDDHSYVTTLRLSASGPGSFGIEKSDNDGKPGPDVAEPLGTMRIPVALGEWHRLVFEVVGDEIVGTVNGHSLTGRHPLIAADKHSLMFTIQSTGAVRNLRIWKAADTAKPEWAQERERLRALAEAAKAEKARR